MTHCGVNLYPTRDSTTLQRSFSGGQEVLPFLYWANYGELGDKLL